MITSKMINCYQPSQVMIYQRMLDIQLPTNFLEIASVSPPVSHPAEAETTFLAVHLLDTIGLMIPAVRPPLLTRLPFANRTICGQFCSKVLGLADQGVLRAVGHVSGVSNMILPCLVMCSMSI